MLTIHFQAVNYKADVKLKEYATKRVNKLSLLHNRILEILIFTKLENSSNRINKWAEIKIEIPGDDIIVKKTSKSFEESINAAAESAERILKRRRGKERVI